MSCWCEFSMFGISHFLEVEFADFIVFEPLCWKFTIQISSHNRDQLEVGIRLVLDIRDCRLILGGKVNSTFVKCLAELNEFLLDLSSVHSISTDLTVDCTFDGWFLNLVILQSVVGFTILTLSVHPMLLLYLKAELKSFLSKFYSLLMWSVGFDGGIAT